MVKQLFIFLSIYFLMNDCKAQAPQVQWSKCFGGTKEDRAFSVVQTADGGFVVAGTTYSNDGDVSGLHGNFSLDDAWLIKLDAGGNLIWQKCIGGSLGEEDYAMKGTYDGGFILACNNSSIDFDATGCGLHGSDDYWLVKMDALGNIQWQKCYGGTDNEESLDIIQTLDSGFLAIGFSDSNDGDVTGNHYHDYWAIKTDALGNLQWQKAIGGSDYDEPAAVLQTSNGGYIITGWTLSNDFDVSGSHGGFDYWAAELDSSGNLQNQHCYGGSGGEISTAIISDGNNGYFLYGGTASNDGDVTGYHGQNDLWLVHVDSSLNIISQNCIGGTGIDEASSMTRTMDGEMLLTGNAYEPNDSIILCNYGDVDGIFIKLDSSGNIKWSKCVGGSGEDYITCVKQSSDGGYIACGYTSSNDSNVTGFHHGNCTFQVGCPFDYWVVKLAPIGLAVPENNQTPELTTWFDETNLHFQFTSDKTQIASIKLIDAMGRILRSQNFQIATGLNKSNIPIDQIASGVYIVSLQSQDIIMTKRVIVN
jgi:hypothetical protein